MKLSKIEFDVIVIGGGGSGMTASLQISKLGFSCALISKVFPTRSHTVSAQGGITVALGNIHEDDWKWHMYDTVKGSDYIGDQNAIEYMCSAGPKAVIELEHMGMPFSRLDNGCIYQRPFGGQTKNFGLEQAARTAAVADRTGHALLHTLYQQNLKNKTTFFSEWYSLDLVKNQDDSIVGCVALCIRTGEVVYFKSKATILATGGAGRIYKSTTNAFINTGDGIGMAVRAQIPLQDMEMWQFHPTGIIGSGILITEGCRGEGGYLINKDNERFMEKYAPHVKDLASRDVVARSIMIEINEGRGFKHDLYGQYVKLKINHLGKDVITSKLPGVLELSKTFAHINPLEKSIPVIPTCHYMMGGIPTKINCQVITVNDHGEDIIIPGLFAVGEVACVSVHGANRLGGNSLLDLIVFGRAVAINMKQSLIEQGNMRDATDSDIEKSLMRLTHWNNTRFGEDPIKIRKELQNCMQNNFSVFREGHVMQQALKELCILHERIKCAYLTDKSDQFNTQRIECLELDNLIETALVTAKAAIFRTESRGAHSRFDFPDRDDNNWLCHTLYVPKFKKMFRRAINIETKICQSFKPKIRTY